MLDRRDHQFVGTLGFAAMLAVFLAVLAEAYAGVERRGLLAAAVWIALVPVAWRLTYRESGWYGLEPMDLSDFASAVLIAAGSVVAMYAARRLLPEAVPGWLQLLVAVAVLGPVATRGYRWLARRAPGLDPEYGS